MKLIKKLDMRPNKTGGRLIRWALFHCDYCNKNVEKTYENGKRNKSCGCYSGALIGNKQTIHSDSYNGEFYRLYRIWSSMKARCYNQNGNMYHRYGGRGITVCDEWRNSYPEFKKWSLANSYSDKLTIDRINNDGNYEPKNCRWVTSRENQRNSSNCKLNLSDVQKIRLLKDNTNISYKLLSDIFNISYHEVWSIINNRVWQD